MKKPYKHYKIYKHPNDMLAMLLLFVINPVMLTVCLGLFIHALVKTFF